MTRNTCKLILVLLACAAPLVAAAVRAESNSVPAGGLNAAADQGTNQQQQQINGADVNGLGAEEKPSGSVIAMPGGDRSWIVYLAGAGLLLSLAAAYVVWTRSRSKPPFRCFCQAA